MKKTVFALLVLFFAVYSVYAQDPEVFSDEGLIQPEITIYSSAKITGTPKTIPFSSNQPFFDDFSQSSQFPDTAKWFDDASMRMPLKYRYGAKQNPSEGVLTFDGLKSDGMPYSIILSTGWSDVLESHYIDLSQQQPFDSVILSFYLQPQGYGDAPESSDSMYVELRDNTGNWQRVYSKGGTYNTPFQKIMYTLNDPAFFHNEFQIRFRRKGNLNSHIDLWHLDYVFMGVGRSVTDSSHSDVALVGISRPVTAPFTAIPYQQFTGKTLMQPFEVNVNNLKNIQSSLYIQAEITDPVGNNVFTTGNQLNNTPLINAGEFYTDAFPAFGDQAMNALNASYKISVNLPPDADNVVSNNKISEIYRVDSVFAMDDGESEGSYGITEARGFGQKYTISSPDYIPAVWISFMPRVHFSTVTQQSTFMNQYPFRLTIWNKPHPDSILYQQTNVVVEYSDSVDGFVRYPLYEPVPVSGDIWVGVEQTDNKPIGVGLDMNYDNRSYMAWDSVGYWVTSQIKGTLMIRPELQNVQYHPLTSIKAGTSEKLWKIFPVPAENQNIRITGLPENSECYYRVMDIQGKEAASGHFWATSGYTRLDIPPLKTGCYFIELKRKTENGGFVREFEKIIISE
ncbi:MAG: hypothetical protein K1X92_16100 [Bacteroidia bacterium]|nr:hypothetical protein [Bacteroidia bacterium]